MGLVQRRGIGDTLTPLLRGEGIDEQMGRTDKALVHRGSGLDGPQLIHQGLVDTAAKLRQGFGQDKVLLRTIKLHCVEATGIHDRYVGAQPLADGFIRRAHFVFEQLQCQQDTCRDRVATPMGAFGKAAGKALLNGVDQRGPGKCIGPLADGIGFGDDVGNLEPGAATVKPMLKVTE